MRKRSRVPLVRPQDGAGHRKHHRHNSQVEDNFPQMNGLVRPFFGRQISRPAAIQWIRHVAHT